MLGFALTLHSRRGRRVFRRRLARRPPQPAPHRCQQRRPTRAEGHAGPGAAGEASRRGRHQRRPVSGRVAGRLRWREVLSRTTSELRRALGVRTHNEHWLGLPAIRSQPEVQLEIFVAVLTVLEPAIREELPRHDGLARRAQPVIRRNDERFALRCPSTHVASCALDHCESHVGHVAVAARSVA